MPALVRHLSGTPVSVPALVRHLSGTPVSVPALVPVRHLSSIPVTVLARVHVRHLSRAAVDVFCHVHAHGRRLSCTSVRLSFVFDLTCFYPPNRGYCFHFVCLSVRLSGTLNFLIFCA